MGVLKRTCRGEYRGGTPSVIIRSGGMYAARAVSCRAQWAMKAGEGPVSHRA